MRHVPLSDVHASLRALDAVLADADRRGDADAIASGHTHLPWHRVVAGVRAAGLPDDLAELPRTGGRPGVFAAGT